MTTYTTEKGRTHTNIFDAVTGEYVCQLRNKEVRAWLVRAEISAAKDAEWAALERTNRVNRVQAYLAARAVRPAAPVQLNLF